MLKIKTIIKETDHKKLTVYVLLRILVIISMIMQFLKGNYNNVLLCILTLILFLIPSFVNHKLKIELPSLLESLIYCFIFAAEILGEIQNFYGIIPEWDTMLHTINGFLCGAIGFSLIDILNQNERFHITLTPIFVVLVSFCFSMTIGVLWEFFEYGADQLLRKDMQKDSIVKNIASVQLDDEKQDKITQIDNIEYTVIHNQTGNIVVEGGYLDIGLKDTMGDLLVNLIGAFVFSIIGYLYIKNRDDYRFAENFIPRLKHKDSVE